MTSPSASDLPAPAGQLDLPTETPSPSVGANSAHLFDLIAKQTFFNELSPRQLQMLTESAMEIRFEAGEEIFKEGSPANRFYLILEGAVVLESELPDREVIPVQKLGPGEDLGWSWLFPPYLLQSSARALEPTWTIFFYGTRLREECDSGHELGYHLTRRVAEVLIRRLDATQKRLIECVVTGKLGGSVPSGETQVESNMAD